MFINVTTRQQISIYSIAPTDICLLVPPTFGKVGVQKKFFRSLRSRILFCTPHLKIRGAAHGSATPHSKGAGLIAPQYFRFPYLCPHPLTSNDQTQRSNTYMRRGVLGVSHAPCKQGSVVK